MPKAKSKSKKSRVASKGTGALRPHFKIWAGILIVLIIAVVGFVVVRFSNAYQQGEEIYVYCTEGRCGRIGSTLGTRARDYYGAKLTKVTVFPNSGCYSGYVYTIPGLNNQQRIQFAWKASSRNTTLLCLDSGSSPR